MWLFCVKEKAAYVMRSSDWISDVCSSDLRPGTQLRIATSNWAGDGFFLLGDLPLRPTRLAGFTVFTLDIPVIEPGFVNLRIRGGSGESAPVLLREIGRASCRERVCQY